MMIMEFSPVTWWAAKKRDWITVHNTNKYLREMEKTQYINLSKQGCTTILINTAVKILQKRNVNNYQLGFHLQDGYMDEYVNQQTNDLDDSTTGNITITDPVQDAEIILQQHCQNHMFIMKV